MKSCPVAVLSRVFHLHFYHYNFYQMETQMKVIAMIIWLSDLDLYLNSDIILLLSLVL